MCDSVANLNIHFRTTHPLVKCKKCGKCLAMLNTLKHPAYEHKKKTKKCPDCDKSFVFSSLLNDHQKTHRKLKPFLCPWIQNGVCCTHDFNYKGDLNRHYRSHTEQPFKCKLCDYTNKDKRNLMQHMRKHGDKNHYFCPKCKKGMRYWMQLKRHNC